MQLEELEDYFKGRLPLMLWGPPGVGKSSRVQQLAQKLKLPLVELRLAQLSLVDLRGLPRIEAGQTRWYPPTLLPTAEASPEGILLLDDITSASIQVQSAAYQLALERRLGDYSLPTGWWICMAGYWPEDQPLAETTASLLNRFVHRKLEPDLEQWTRWAMGAKIDPRIIGFLYFKPALLFVPPVLNRGLGEPGFPTPRSWAFVNTLLQAGLARSENLVGAIGQAAAIEFSHYLAASRSLPSLDAILHEPTQAPLPERPELGYAVIISLVAGGWGYEQAVSAYLLRLPNRDLIRFGLTLALSHWPELLTAEPIVAYLLENQQAWVGVS
ncbi:AAA family ATPase [Leptolyngbya sp. FACHB-261]|uniref:AAA family ATPase n=1 Tax=Leptolyngbya sp. FACHB-261 TaxID=2692806 RepID=UPI0016858B3C|nr:AAA family ATPase [Leptolyngbya sp. FACHB-261]MBD2102206.1 AAA family ATPase [Leptolyngbya sp. FACHB-261]